MSGHSIKRKITQPASVVYCNCGRAIPGHDDDHAQRLHATHKANPALTPEQVSDATPKPAWLVEYWAKRGRNI